MRIGFLYYNCLGFDLASGYTLHYTEYCSGSSVQKDSFHLVAVAGWSCGEVLKFTWSWARDRYRTHSGARLSISS